ncbi:MAG: radical SAM protein [Planctomycetota bacterium]
MSGLRIVDDDLLKCGLRLPGVRRRANALAQLPPLGLLTIAGCVERSWSIEFVDDDGSSDKQAITERIVRTRPDVVAFSTLTPAADRAAAIAEQLSAHQIHTIVGGLHATATPGWCQSRFDSVGAGDGESIFSEMLDDWKSNRLASLYRPARSADLSESPMPRWDLWKRADAPRFTIQTMRGCPWGCQFCAASRLLGPARAKPDQQIIDEIRYVGQRQQRPWIELADDNTFACHREAGPWLDVLRETKAKWFTESDWLIGRRPHLLARIAASGCRQILIGLESPIHRFPGMGGKAGSWEEVIKCVNAIQSAGIAVNACFIVGVDGETPDTIDALSRYLSTAPFAEIQVTLQTPFPGTKLYDQMKADDRLLFHNFERYTLFDVTYQPDAMSVETLRRSFRNLVRQVYSNAATSRRTKIARQIAQIRRSRQCV